MNGREDHCFWEKAEGSTKLKLKGREVSGSIAESLFTLPWCQTGKLMP